MAAGVSDNERAVLMALCVEPDHYFPFASISERSGVPRHLVRRTVRALARKGLAEFRRGLWSDDGEMVGAGYGATAAGVELHRSLAEVR